MAEVAFPRGGAVKRERSDGTSSKSNKKKAEPKAAPDLNELFNKETKEESVAGKLPRYVELLKFKTLSVGMRLWGAVAEVSARDLVVSLPHGLKGFVAPAECSDALAAQLATAGGETLSSDSDDNSDDEEHAPRAGKRAAKPAAVLAASLADSFRVGQLVCCVVTALLGKESSGGKKAARVELSLRLSKLHAGMALSDLQPGSCVPAVVSSVEDHGLIVSFGITGVSGFLVAADAAAAAKAAGVESLAPGAHVQCTVSKVDKKRKLVTVVAASNTEPLKEADGLTLAALMPGTLVAAKVQAVLPDGLLLNFLSCFTGTVDWFHLTEELPTREWSKAYAEKQRLNARILYVDAELKRVGLTLSPSLVKGGPLPPPLPTGSVVQQAKVCRIDPGLGMLMRASAVVDGKTLARTAYVHISEASDERVEKLEKTFTPGQQLPGRILGQRLMDGLGTMSLKTTVVEQEIFTYDDAWPGRVVKGLIVQVEEWGVLLKLSDSIKALCPLAHLSDAPRSKISAKFVVGTRLKVRILEADPSRRRVTVTAKKTLLNSKLPIVATAGSAPGTVTHGYVTGLEPYGVFVSFYGGKKGLARLADLGLAQEQTPHDAFALHQVVKAKVLGADPKGAGRLRLSLDSGAVGASSADVASQAALFELGDVVTTRVAAAVPSDANAPLDVLIQRADGTGAEVRALLEASHLSDHPAAAAALRAAVAPGTPLGQCVVLERRDAAGGGAGWRVSRKASLVAAGSETPAALSQLKAGSVHAGYVASVTDAGCFVRFLGRLTGLAPVPQLADTFVTDPKQHFAPGQSVRAAVLDVDDARQRVMLSLKPSQCGGGGSSGAELLGSLLADLETVHALIPTAEAGVDASLAVGAVVEGTVSDVKEYGVLVNLAAHSELVGFAALHQARDGLKPGDKVSAVVLDVSKSEGIVDLSLRAQLLPEASSKSTKKRKTAAAAPVVGEEVAVEVELVKEEYLVVTLPQHNNALAVLPTKEWNLRLVDVHATFQPRQRLAATVFSAASPATGNRLLLSVAKEAAGAGKRKAGSDDTDKGKKKGRPAAEELVGTVLAGQVSAVKATHLDVTLSNRWRGRVHITEARLQPGDAGLAAKFKVGDKVEAEVLGVAQAADGSNTGALELTQRFSGDGDAAARPSLEALAPGDTLGPCFVQQVGADFLWAALSPTVRARVFVLDAADDLETLRHFGARFKPGQRLEGATVLARDLARRTLDLTLRPHAGGGKLKVGSVLPGRVAKLLPGVGLNVQLGARLFGRVHLTDVRDRWTEAPLEGVAEGQFVRCCVVHAGDKLDLSLRASRGGCEASTAAPSSAKKKSKKEAEAEVVPEVEKKSLPAVGSVVRGYVKSASTRGLFVALSRSVDAYARLCNLAETFVTEPAASFPAGMLVTARVMSVDGRGRVEVTLKMEQPVGVAAGGALAATRAAAIAALTVGQTVWGDVRKLESFGTFIQLDGAGAVSGMCHVSELADEFVKEASSVVQPGDRVRARVLRVDVEKGKVYLSLKPSNFDEEFLDPKAPTATKTTFADDEEEEGSDDGGSSEDEEEGEGEKAEQGSDSDDASSDDEDEEEAVKPAPSKAAKPVAALIEEDGMDWEGEVTKALTGENKEGAGAKAEEQDAKKSKREKKRAKEAREETVAAAEQARLHGNTAPTSIAEFEKALLTAGNSSFVWIKWLAWHVARGELPAARAVAEKALATIHYREDAERQNVWLAFLNLENLYGLPTPAEAVGVLFQRAVQATDGKKLHLAVAAMYERTSQPEAAEALLKAACRKHAGSAKVWLRHVQHLLGAGKGAAAKAVMDRSLQSLPKRKHIKVISQTALLEFKEGDAERGRSIMEGVLRNFPRRTDLWSVYLDQEVKLNDTARARALFERAVSLSLPPRKMKPLFKKWLDFEASHGDAASAERVKQAAMAFAEQNL